MEMVDGVPHRYLGDGVYAKADGMGGVWLLANDHKNPTDKVYLEPSVHRNYLQFVEDLRNIKET